MALTFVEFVGWSTICICTTSIIIRASRFLYTTWIGPLCSQNVNLADYKIWAVVTGATDGIGKSFAKQLAAKGLNVALVSRNQEKLNEVARELKLTTKNSVRIRTIAVDFTEPQAPYETLENELDSLDVGILVNNVGMALDFSELSAIDNGYRLNNIVNCNALSMARMCHLVLPKMVEKKRGIIINVGSMTGTIPTPLALMYGATKSFTNKFSEDLAAEVKKHGIIVQTLKPGYVLTKLVGHINRPSLLAPLPDVYAKSALQTLGLESSTAGYWPHKIQLRTLEWANFVVPRSWLQYLMIKFYESRRRKVLS